MGISMVVTSGKGGAGKSTVSAGLGRALARRGLRVLLVDCDAGLRTLDSLTGTEENLVFDISDVVCGRCAPAEAIYACPTEGNLFLLPAPVSVENRVSPAVMRRLVPMLKQYYDYVLLDSPAGVGRGFSAAACAAEKALVVCGPDPVGVRGAVAVRELLEKIPVTDIRLVINRFDRADFSVGGLYEDLDAVIDHSGIRLLGVVPEDVLMTAAFLKGQSADRRLKGMLAMERIAARLQGERVPISPLG